MEDRPLILGQTCKTTPLAFPKGMKKVCELCQSPACLQCAMWWVTFYCHAEYQRVDWVGIHERICKLFVPIPIVVYFHELFRLELIEICTLVAQSKLFEGKHQEAWPAALLCLRYTEDVHGPQSVHQAHAFLLLAEANIGLGNLALAAELLSQAEWVLLETPECRNSLLQRLTRNFGCLHAATGNLEDARFYFANDIFFATVEFGVNSTVTAGSLFLMVDVFAKMKKTVITRSLYQEVRSVLHIKYDEDYKLHLKKRRVGNSDQSNKDLAQIALVTYSLSVLRLPQGELLAGARHDTVTHFLLVSSQDWITSK
uniref:MYND-type domain-containing protein n=1 Tax=Oryzias latipes TaxID=8090 RepID=A0A3P9IZU1_ORYLA